MPAQAATGFHGPLRRGEFPPRCSPFLSEFGATRLAQINSRVPPEVARPVWAKLPLPAGAAPGQPNGAAAAWADPGPKPNPKPTPAGRAESRGERGEPAGRERGWIRERARVDPAALLHSACIAHGKSRRPYRHHTSPRCQPRCVPLASLPAISPACPCAIFLPRHRIAFEATYGRFVLLRPFGAGFGESPRTRGRKCRP